MKNKIWIYLIILIGVLTILINSCDKNDYHVPVPVPSEPGYDNDGNVFQTVIIGKQVWMAENLKTTSYRDGSPIPLVTDLKKWSGIAYNGDVYCNFDNDTNYSNIYGRIYSWSAVNNIRNIAPIGWRVPTHGDWLELITFLGGKEIAGGKLKETGTNHWRSPNTGATNESGFTALQAGCCFASEFGTFKYVYWWSSTEEEGNSFMAWFFSITSDSRGVYMGKASTELGFSVRCLRN